jgi:hypothetical protein
VCVCVRVCVEVASVQLVVRKRLPKEVARKRLPKEVVRKRLLVYNYCQLVVRKTARVLVQFTTTKVQR